MGSCHFVGGIPQHISCLGLRQIFTASSSGRKPQNSIPDWEYSPGILGSLLGTFKYAFWIDSFDKTDLA